MNLYPRLSLPLRISAEQFPRSLANGREEEEPEGRGAFFQENPSTVCLKRYWYRHKLILGFRYLQKRREKAELVVHHAHQPFTSLTTSHIRILTFHLQDIIAEDQKPLWYLDQKYRPKTQVIFRNYVYECLKAHRSTRDNTPLESPVHWALVSEVQTLSQQSKRATFFPTERGNQTLQHALEVAKAYLAASARAIEIRLTTELETCLNLTCDYTVSLEDDRLPGRKVRGKVKAYRLSFRGTSGEIKADIVLGCALGMPSDALSSRAPSERSKSKKEALYAEKRTWEEGYESLPSRLTTTPSGLSFLPFEDQGPNTGILYPHRLSAWDLVEAVHIIHPPEEQERLLKAQEYPLGPDLESQLDALKTDICFDLADLRPTPVLEHTFQVHVPTPWTAPCHIDLGQTDLSQEKLDK